MTKKYWPSLVFVAGLLSGQSSFSDQRYAIDAYIGKADQQNVYTGLPTITGYETSKGIKASLYISRYVLLEIGYDDYGKGTDSYIDNFGDTITNTLDSNAYKVGFQGGWVLNDKMVLNGRAGLALWELDFSEADSAFPGQIFTDSDEGVDAYYGVGLQFDLEKNFRLSLDYDILEFSPVIGAANTDHRIENLSLSAGFTF